MYMGCFQLRSNQGNSLTFTFLGSKCVIFIYRKTCNRKFTKIIQTLQIKFWNVILEITDGELHCVTEFVTSVRNVLGYWKTPFSVGTATSDEQSGFTVNNYWVWTNLQSHCMVACYCPVWEKLASGQHPAVWTSSNKATNEVINFSVLCWGQT